MKQTETKWMPAILCAGLVLGALTAAGPAEAQKSKNVKSSASASTAKSRAYRSSAKRKSVVIKIDNTIEGNRMRRLGLQAAAQKRADAAALAAANATYQNEQAALAAQNGDATLADQGLNGNFPFYGADAYGSFLVPPPLAQGPGLLNGPVNVNGPFYGPNGIGPFFGTYGAFTGSDDTFWPGFTRTITVPPFGSIRYN